jgi:ribosomal protein L7/L12
MLIHIGSQQFANVAEMEKAFEETVGKPFVQIDSEEVATRPVIEAREQSILTALRDGEITFPNLRGQKIACIKLVRTLVPSFGLKEAKDFVEDYSHRF